MADRDAGRPLYVYGNRAPPLLGQPGDDEALQRAAEAELNKLLQARRPLDARFVHGNEFGIAKRLAQQEVLAMEQNTSCARKDLSVANSFDLEDNPGHDREWWAPSGASADGRHDR
jgi:hypothetical protein